SDSAAPNSAARLADPADRATPAKSVQPASGGAFEQRIAHQVHNFPRDLSAHLDDQLLRFLRDESVPDLNALASLPSEDRELLTALLDGLSNFRSLIRAENNLLVSRKIRPLLEMSDRLRNQADLAIPV